jgi:hypothetical protein
MTANRSKLKQITDDGKKVNRKTKNKKGSTMSAITKSRFQDKSIHDAAIDGQLGEKGN